MTSQQAQKKFVNDIDAWHERVYSLRGSTDKKTRANITRWLNDFRRIFYGGMVQAGASKTYESVKMILGIVKKELTLLDFKEEYINEVRKLARPDYSKSIMLSRSLASRFGKNYRSFYLKWDDMVAKFPGIPFKEIRKKFEKQLISKSVSLIDKAGRTWNPKAYANMYVRTRASKISTEIERQVMEENGLNLVQITDANTVTPICTLFENKYWSLDGRGLPKLEVYPPFHPNCRHQFIAVDPRYLEKYKAQNRKLDREIAKKKAEWTPAQKSAVVRQMAWLKANQAV